MTFLRPAPSNSSRLFLSLLGSFAAGALGACSSAPAGELSVLLEAEDTIQGGVEAGEGAENIRDGWSASFSTFAVALGNVGVERDGERTTAPESVLVDLVEIPESGLDLLSLEGLSEGRYDFGFSVIGAAGVESSAGVDEDVASRMREDNLSYLIQGSLSKAAGVSCPPVELAEPGDRSTKGENESGVPCYENSPISFEFPVARTSVLGPCEIDGVPGVAIVDGAKKSVAITIHGDHVFFNGFPESEGSVTRLAQWLADADLNLDGRVSWEELGKLRPSDLSEFDARYQLGGSPIDIETLQDFVAAEVLTQGHFQGEGECAVAID